MGKHQQADDEDDGLLLEAVGRSRKTTTNTASKMKVTVCFGNVRVIVPCPNREMLVRDLIHQATLRYRKATGKGADSWVAVHKLKSQSDGGILDPDDKLVDVADDREQIMAIYEEDHDGMPSLQHNAGDGTSASSVGTNSPDIFQSSDHKFQPFTRTDIEITGEELSQGPSSGSPSSSGVTLQVRRGSESALNRLSPVLMSPPDPSKRWSAAPIVDEDVLEENHRVKDRNRTEVSNGSQVSVSSSSRENSVIYNHAAALNNNLMTNNNGNIMAVHNFNSVNKKVPSGNQQSSGNLPRSASAGASMSLSLSVASSNSMNNGDSSSNGGHNFVHYRQHPPDTLSVPSRFSRDSNRLSMQFSGDSGAKWADAADRAHFLSLRKEPVGANASPETPSDSIPPPPQHFSTPISSTAPQFRSPTHNGITYEEYDDEDINSVLSDPTTPTEEVIEMILRYEVGPLGIHLVPEHKASAKNQGLIVQGVEPGGRIDRDGRLQAQDKIIEINGHTLLGVPFQQAQELFREGLNTPELKLKVVKNGGMQRFQNSVHHLVSKFNGEGEEKENLIHSHERIVGDSKVATVSATKKSPLQAIPLARPSSTTSLISSNTRKIGRKYDIDLQKGQQGLGFSITTRDNPAGGNCPIYIKNILPTGAAIDDGRLRPGDRLLEVNGIEITGKSQAEAVSILRNVPQGGIVKLVVSRQERVDLSPKLPRQIPPEKVSEDIPAVPWSEREILVLDIPVLDTEKAGLGISVKGKTTSPEKGGMIDMGIFIKSVIHGGAASRDGRLKSNDQLMNINGISLLDRSNTDAMETLKRTMTQDGPKPKPGYINLTIARRVPSSSAPTTDISGCGSSASGDEMDSWGSRNISMSADGSRGDEKSATEVNPAMGSTHQFVAPYNVNQNRSQVPNTIPNHNQQNGNLYNRSSSLRRVETRKSPEDGHSGQSQPRTNSQSPSPYGRSSMELLRNPVLERLTGKSNAGNPAVRNESYYRATNETYNNALIQSLMSNNRNSRDRNKTQTVQTQQGETVLLEGEYSPPQKPPRRSRSSTPEDGLTPRRPSVVEVPTPAASSCGLPPSDATYASQTSLEDAAGGFARDAFGRQSMSEKRHATLDAKGTDTYQRNKKIREERERHRQMMIQQEGMNDQRRAEQLARERNLQDQLARRGTKRPFANSTESELDQRALSQEQLNQSFQHQQQHYPRSQPSSPPLISPSGKRGLGDQLKELLQQRGHKQTHRPDAPVGPGMQRINSVDSLVESLKQHSRHMPQPDRHQHDQHEASFKGSKKDIGPSLGMKKSSSLESLQTMVQDFQIQEDVKSGYGPARNAPAAVRVVRGRGCNESFRQAVDRSYEAPLGELGNGMETLAEEETESCISGAYGHTRSSQPYPEPSEYESEGIYGKKGAAKKKQGIFRGLGSMFRFGRHRKSSHGTSGLSAADIRKQQSEIERNDREEAEQADQKEKARQAAHAEQVRIHEQYQRLVEKQKQESPYGITVSISNKNGDGNYGTVGPYQSAQSNLRPNHPFRKSMDSGRGSHQASRSVEREREQRGREAVYNQGQGQQDVNGNPNSNTPNHLRSASYDVYNEMTRPGSRVGFVDPKKYSHYINYEEIRHHLNDDTKEKSKGNGNQRRRLSEDQIRQMKNTVVEQRKKAILESRRHQQHYHSQRREHPREKLDRPVSNFYEYESVQAAMHAQQQGPSSQMQHPQQQGSSQQQQHPQNPIYVVKNHNGNNGVTLPSPSTLPFNSIALRQRSPSQFQAVPPVTVLHNRQQQFTNGHGHMNGNGNASSGSATLQLLQHQKQQQQQQKPNSLPRRSQKEPSQQPISPIQSQPQPISSTNHRHPQQFTALGNPAGRYTLSHSGSSSHTHAHSHSTQVTKGHGLPSTQQPMPSHVSRHFVVGQQNYQHGGHGQHQVQHQMNSTPPTLGSKV